MTKTLLALLLTALLLGSNAWVPHVQAALPPQATPDGNVSLRSLEPEAKRMTTAEVRAFWTPERMAAAQPVPDSAFERRASSRPATQRLTQADGAATYVGGYNEGGSETSSTTGTVPGSNSSTPNFTYPFVYARSFINIPIFIRTIGRLFFQNDSYGGSFVCSGAAVTSGGGNQALVLTAGHCLAAGINDPSGNSYNMLFVPATLYGSSPYGTWSDYDRWVRSSWYASANEREDFGFVVTDHSSNPCGAIGPCTGAQGLAWNQPVNQYFWDFGYPAAGSFPGDQPVICTAGLGRLDNLSTGIGALPLGIGCDMTNGSSGGPWIIQGKAVNKGYVNGVNSYKYLNPSQPEAVYGPYFASNFGSLWNSARVQVVP